MISDDTALGGLLEEHPALAEVLEAYHPHFRHLRKKLLQKIMAPHVTVAQAAQIAGVPPEELVRVLRCASGELEAGREPLPAEGGGATADRSAPGRPEERPRPAALADLAASRQVALDVRADIQRGQEPFARIMAAVKGLGEDQVLVLRAPFEPLPLYEVLGRRGFRHWSECLAPDDWSVWFYREAPAPAAESARPAGQPGAGAMVRLDVRGLEPPEPMIRVLTLLEELGPDQRLEVLHDRRPFFLYPHLEDRDFAHETDDSQPGVVRILIWKRGGPP